jgi:hypothetical protein
MNPLQIKGVHMGMHYMGISYINIHYMGMHYMRKIVTSIHDPQPSFQ